MELSPAVEHAPRESAYDVERYAIDIGIFPDRRRIEATCRILLWPRAISLASADFDLEDLDVSAVRDDRGRPLPFARTPGNLHVSFVEPVPPGSCVEVAVDYSGSPRRGLYFRSDRDGVPRQVFTQGECEDSRGWFPCFDAPSDRATSEIRVTMPARWTSVAAGERIERVEHDGLATELWRMETPHPPYLTTLVAGEFAEQSDSSEGIPLLYVADGHLAPELRPNLGKAGDILSFFSGLTGLRYPYPKYAQSCVEDFPYGGMENISATTLTDTCLVDEKSRRDATETGLVAHEAAHQWFGDLLTCRDWSHVWLNEGFATYLAALFAEQDRGVDEFRVQMRDMQENYVAADVGKNRRPLVYGVYRRPMDLFFTGHVYGGGAVRLHLLRSVVGDEAFFRGLQIYVANNALRSVVTDDLRRAMETASKADLAGFFHDWFESPGYPEFESSWRYDETRKLLIVSVNQVQDIAGGTPAEFKIPVEIGVRDSQGLRTLRLQLRQRRQIFEVPAPEKPAFVRFDEHGWIPKRLDERKPTDEWIAIAAGDEDVNGRRDAIRVIGRVLAKSSTAEERDKLRDVLLERLAKDGCAVVRAEAAMAVAAVRDAAVRSALSQAAGGDAEARVRSSALKALRAWGADPELAALALREYQAGFSWDTMASAAGLYASAHPNGAFEWIAEQIALETPGDALRVRLLPLLEGFHDPRSLAIAQRFALDAQGGAAGRSTAAREIGLLGRGNPAARATLERLLGSPVCRVRREAIGALAALGDPTSLEALRALYERSTLAPELLAIENAIQTLQGDG